MRPEEDTLFNAGKEERKAASRRTQAPRASRESTANSGRARTTHTKKSKKKRRRQRTFKKVILFFVIAAAVCAGISIFAFSNTRKKEEPVVSHVYASELNGQEKYFAEPIQRDCPWDAERGAYYDADTDCYFWNYKTQNASVWQYWYNGISSEYGSFGWMEWREGRWYIQKEDGAWKLLPEEYISDRLWHLDA